VAPEVDEQQDPVQEATAETVPVEPQTESAQEEPTESESTPAEPTQTEAAPRRAPLGNAQYMGTGKRKTSVARVILRPGDGTTWFNGRTIEDYFPRLTHRAAALAPLKVAGLEGTYDIRVRVHGGGPTGQAGAVRHGIARALVEADPELRIPLKREGFLTRDARQVERKKAGLHKARKAPQFSKR
jgi:small subunit ribosomal protein S9